MTLAVSTWTTDDVLFSAAAPTRVMPLGNGPSALDDRDFEGSRWHDVEIRSLGV